MKAKRRLGQHFLRDVEVLQDIALVADARTSGGVLEIGPGEGALTAFLLQGGRPVVAIEKDPDLVHALADRFGAQLRVVEGDALTADLEALLPQVGERLPIVVGNLPYNVGSAIYQRLLKMRAQLARVVVMLQREVAQRIVAGPGSKTYGVPSVLTALTARAHIVSEVPPTAFKPRPKVHSAVVLVECGAPLSPEAALTPDEHEGFAAFISRLFQSRRKVLSNARGSDDRFLAALERVGIDPMSRVERIAPADLLALYRALSGSPT